MVTIRSAIFLDSMFYINLKAKVSATVRLFGGDLSHTPFLIDKVFEKKTHIVSLSNHTYGTLRYAGF